MKYNKKIVDRICQMIKSDSYTIAEICKSVGLAESTYYKWQAENVEFSESIKKAEDERMNFFVTEAKKSLLKKLQGYTVDETKTVYEPNKKDGEIAKPKIKEQTIVKKHFQPDTAAIIFTLTNGDPANWKNRQNTEHSGKLAINDISDEELDKKLSELEKKLKD